MWLARFWGQKCVNQHILGWKFIYKKLLNNGEKMIIFWGKKITFLGDIGHFWGSLVTLCWPMYCTQYQIHKKILAGSELLPPSLGNASISTSIVTATLPLLQTVNILINTFFFAPNEKFFRPTISCWYLFHQIEFQLYIKDCHAFIWVLRGTAQDDK